ncbi:MAG: hypothetical protein L6Q97_14830, partial [Thermoanaerobaculia bacterium]|nr:hypothetical protein [Thermoanaerobaculia bacterium]
GLWIIKKIENSFQAVLDFTTKVLNTSPEQLIFYINTIAILCSLVYLIADIYVFIMRGTRYKIELLFKRYTPEMEEGTLNPNLIPVSEYKRNSNSNSSTNVQNANLMIKEGIAIDLLITNKLSDLEICEILQITPFDLQKYKKLTGDRRV